MNEACLAEFLSGKTNLTLEKAFKDGTHRQSKPEFLLASLSDRLEKFGITRVARITELDRIGIEVYTAVRPNNYGLSVSQGKGIGHDAAKLSGIMEAIEYWHAERPENDLFLASANELAGRRVNSANELWSGVVNPERRILWTLATHLPTGIETAVPFDLVHTNFETDARQFSSGLVATTNGLASGGNVPEAVTHALCEAIERHETAVFGSLPTEARAERALDLSLVNDQNCQGLITQCANAEVGLKVWDATCEIGVPSFIACLADEKDAQMPPGFGAGCHPARGVALCRAITEAAQSRLTRISGARDDLATKFYGKLERMRAKFLVQQSNSSPQRRLSETPDFASNCLVEDFRRVVDRLNEAGHRDVFVVMLADNPHYCVVKVIVPSLLGMEH